MQHYEFSVGGIAMICVGIDMAKDKHDCFFLNSEGAVLANVFTISNNMEGFNILLGKFHACATPGDRALQLQHPRVSS